jgi:pimeloyl-ACP methyl ester carboxylesterase
MLAPRRVTAAGGLSAEYVDAGEGRPVFLLHGNFATWRWWSGVMARGLPGVRFVAPTMRGCPGTRGGGRASVYELPALARDVVAIADQLGVEQFDLVGHSLGGGVALACALDFPERVRGLHLVASASGDALESARDHEATTSQLLKRFNPHRALDRAALLTTLRIGRDLGNSRRWLQGMLARLMPRADLNVVPFDTLLSDAVGMEPVAVVNLYRSLSSWDVRARRVTLQVPTRVLAGREDVLVPVRALEALVREVPGATLTVLDCGHSPMLEAPDAFLAWLEAGVSPPLPAPAPVVAAVPELAREVVPAPIVVVAPPQALALATAPRAGFWTNVLLRVRALATALSRRLAR